MEGGRAEGVLPVKEQLVSSLTTNLTPRAVSQIVNAVFSPHERWSGSWEVCSASQRLVHLGKEPRKEEKRIRRFWHTRDPPPKEITHTAKKLRQKTFC